MNLEKVALEYFNPSSEEDYENVIKIFNEYQQYLKVDLCFQSFDEELKNLKTIYKKPKGTIILAHYYGNIVGCIALKPIEVNNCEMKRLFVKPSYRGLGIGKKLVDLVLEVAKENKYDFMKLDTLTKLNEAVNLYESIGFVKTNSYVFNPLQDVLYFEKKL
jgi:putative acetyltransferase